MTQTTNDVQILLKKDEAMFLMNYLIGCLEETEKDEKNKNYLDVIIDKVAEGIVLYGRDNKII